MEDNFPYGDNDDALIKKVIMKWMIAKQFHPHLQKEKMIMTLTIEKQFSAYNSKKGK